MADFRRWFFALAAVALLAGLTVPASAQTSVAQCVGNAAVPVVVRAEGYSELVGDLTLNCMGGVPTAAGAAVPQVNFSVLLNTNITSKLLSGGLFNEALLIVDEPHSAANPGIPLRNCGLAGEDTTVSGPGVCSITSDGNPAHTYNGTVGHPNVFQGRIGVQQVSGQSNQVVFLGVPFDPPGTTTTRTIRITNIRADAELLGVSSNFFTTNIQMNITANPSTALAINNPQQIVGLVQKGLIVSNTSRLDFTQCLAQPPAGVDSSGVPKGDNAKSPTVTFQEGFADAWKVKNVAQIVSSGNGTLVSGTWTYNGGLALPGSDENQNVPGATYHTETGFENSPSASDPTPTNPPSGFGTGGPAPGLGNAFNDTTGTGTGINGAGIATQGTRLALSFATVPTGSSIWVPGVVYLYRQGTTTGSGSFVVGATTGVAVLVTTGADGSGAFTAAQTTPSAGFVQVSNNLAVYEILFSDPSSLEKMYIPVVVVYTPNLNQNLPAPGVTATVGGSFAPFNLTGSAGWRQPSSTLPVPRFVPGTTPASLFAVNKCACNLLFPWAPSVAGYDTGIALANTSLDPGATYGFKASPQQGTVQLWYYGTGANGGAPPSTQCTNSTTAGACPGNLVVPAGSVLTYVLSSGSSTWGLDNRAAGFAGYVIAQAQFQYCHGFAFITALGAGPLSAAVSEGYLGIVLDPGGLPRTSQALGENDGH